MVETRAEIVLVLKEARELAERLFADAASRPVMTLKGMPRERLPAKYYLVVRRGELILHHEKYGQDTLYASLTQMSKEGLSGHDWDALIEGCADYILEQKDGVRKSQ